MATSGPWSHMAGFGAALSKQDIDNVSAYYAEQPRAVTAKH